MGLFGDLVTGALGGFPDKPKVPAFDKLDLSAEQQKAINANLAALPGSENLAAQVNKFNQDQIQQMLRSAIPNYDALTGQASKNIEALLKGEIPADVSQALQSSDAAKALGMGTAGSGMARNLVARDLGLTSLDLTGKGLTSAESWLQTMNQLERPGFFNLASMFITPQQQANFDVEERDAAWNVQWLKNQLAAIPDPETAAISRDIGNIADVVGSAIPYVGMVNMASSMGGGSGSPMGGGGGSGVNAQGLGGWIGSLFGSGTPTAAGASGALTSGGLSSAFAFF